MVTLNTTNVSVVYMTSSLKISGRLFLVDKDDVIRILRWDLKEVVWLRFGRSLFKPRGLGLTHGSPGCPGGCICILCFLEWEGSRAFVSSHRLNFRIDMRWIDDIYLGICVMCFMPKV